MWSDSRRCLMLARSRPTGVIGQAAASDPQLPLDYESIKVCYRANDRNVANAAAHTRLRRTTYGYIKWPLYGFVHRHIGNTFS